MTNSEKGTIDKTIATVSPELSQFVNGLGLPLSILQQRHVQQIADGLIGEGDKNLSNLYRHFIADPCPKSATDTFCEATERADDVCHPLRKYLVKQAIDLAEAQGTNKRICLSVDDSLNLLSRVLSEAITHARLRYIEGEFRGIGPMMINERLQQML